MSEIADYFNRVASLIRHSQVIDDKVTYLQITPSRGVIDGALDFYDGSRLAFVEVIELTPKGIQKQRYRYQYLRDEQQIFRYDNAPHHPHLSTFPHHKHIAAGKIIEAEEVSLKDLVDEIDRLLAQSYIDES